VIKKIHTIPVAILMMLTMVGCVDNSKKANTSLLTSTGKTGVSFYKKNAGIEGVKVVCGNIENTTSIDGRFVFEEGDDCKLSLAGIPLKSIAASDLVDGGDIVENDPKVLKLLTSLDSKGTLFDGIQITDRKSKLLKSTLEDYNSVGKFPEEDVLTELISEVNEVAEKVTTEVQSNEKKVNGLDKLVSGKTKYFVNSSGEKGYRNYADDGTYIGNITLVDGNTVDTNGTYEVTENTLTIMRELPSITSSVLTYTGGDEEKMNKAKRLLIATGIGIMIIYGAFALVSTFLAGDIQAISQQQIDTPLYEED